MNKLELARQEKESNLNVKFCFVMSSNLAHFWKKRKKLKNKHELLIFGSAQCIYSLRTESHIEIWVNDVSIQFYNFLNLRDQLIIMLRKHNFIDK